MNKERRALELASYGSKSLYRHFKGKWYNVVNIGKCSDNMKLMVAYTAQYNDPKNNIMKGELFFRRYEEFMSTTDKLKYPKAEQDYRFMSISELKGQFGDAKVKTMLKDLED